jgi:phosphotriesterase-related protein
MSDAQKHHRGQVLTVLGPISPAELGVVAVHESLLSVVPGAQYAFDVTINRAEIFDILADKLRQFRANGGGTIVDSTGMFHGRDLPLYEALARETGVNIIASTGMGPEEQLGGYFLTPQTNPPTPWPAEKFSDLFAKEVTEGMVRPRLERRAAAGLITTAADHSGITATEVSLFKGAARAALETGLSVSIRFGKDASAELAEILAEGLSADRVLVGDLDRADAAGVATSIAAQGSYVGVDHVGQYSSSYISDEARVALAKELIAAGHIDRIILSSNSAGVAKGHEAPAVSFDTVLTSFVPQLTAAGVSEAEITRILVDNPRELLTVRAATAVKNTGA